MLVMGASPKSHQAWETTGNSGNGDRLAHYRSAGDICTCHPIAERRTLQHVAMATLFARGLSVVAYSNFFVYLTFVTMMHIWPWFSVISTIWIMWESIPCLLLWKVDYFDRSAVFVTCIFLYELIKDNENYSPFFSADDIYWRRRTAEKTRTEDNVALKQ